MTIKCLHCENVLVKGMNIKEYKKKYPNEKYMWCCYCHKTFPINIIEKEVEKKDGI